MRSDSSRFEAIVFGTLVDFIETLKFVKSSRSMSSTNSTAAVTTFGAHTIHASYAGSSGLSGIAGSASLVISAALGPETKVNSSTAGSGQTPAVAALKSGHVVVWASSSQDGSGFGIYGQRYSATGRQGRGVPHQHHDCGRSDPARRRRAGRRRLCGAVAVSGPGRLRLRHLCAALRGQRGEGRQEFRVNTVTLKDQSLPAVAPLAAGGFVAAWTSNGEDGSGLGVYAQLYGALGEAVGGEFRVNTTIRASSHTLRSRA